MLDFYSNKLQLHAKLRAIQKKGNSKNTCPKNIFIEIQYRYKIKINLSLDVPETADAKATDALWGKGIPGRLFTGLML